MGPDTEHPCGTRDSAVGGVAGRCQEQGSRHLLTVSFLPCNLTPAWSLRTVARNDSPRLEGDHTASRLETLGTLRGDAS